MTLDVPELNISIIEYGKLRDENEDRLDHIKTLSQEPGKHLLVDEDFKISILPEFEQRAKEIFAKIRHLRQQNDNVSKYLSFSLDVLKKYDIPINTSKDDTPYSANLENVRIQENTKLHSLISHLKDDFTNDKITASEVEKKKKTYQAAHETRCSEVLKAKDELQAFISALPAGA